ncbi:MAG TPA: GNAT family N-acetyltransferase [Candidatus Limnocylindrales bacterium]|nr:GNAT family N-acetyltransferase [Candidatus Limnocylindrales bacterium]
MAFTVRPVSEAELPAWFDAAQTVFFMWSWGDGEAAAAFRRPQMDLERTIGAFDDGEIVGTFRTFATELTLPGGRAVPASAVTSVTVRSTHRRRGVLSAMAGDDIARTVERAEPVGILFASEWPIYGRYGYGPASWDASWAIRTRATRFKHPADGRVEVMAPKLARALLPPIYERYRLGQAGEITRNDPRWDRMLGIVQPPGRPEPGPTVAAVHRDTNGEPDAYALYHGEEKWDEGIPDNVLLLDELHGATEAAEIELWQFLCSIDLVATIKAGTRRVREPLPWYLEDARAARLKEVGEGLWLRIYDVPAVLGGRAYESSDRLVIEVVDTVGGRPGPATGRFELDATADGATCRPTTREADLSLEVSALGAAVLGGTNLADAVRAGGASEATPGALRRAAALLRTADEPWCTTHF